MGNSLGGKKTTKVMKIDGETFKLKTPVKAGDVLKNHPGLVLLESEAVKHYGVRAKPLEAHKELQPKRLYFLVDLPKETVPRRVRSGINMSAKDRLESLVLSRRSASDLTIMKSQTQIRNMQGVVMVEEQEGSEKNNDGGVRLKMRLPKTDVEKLIKSSKDDAEAAKRIMSLYMSNGNKSEIEKNGEGIMVMNQEMHWKCSRVGECKKAREKRVSFMPISEGGSPIAVAL